MKGGTGNMRIKRRTAERIGHVVIILILTLFAFACIYPFWHVLMYSISDSRKAMTGGLFLVPRKPTLLSYSMIFKTRQIYVAYSNTILRTLLGTGLSVLLTALTAFPLSLKRMRGRQFFSMMIFFTMLFNGGLIPTFLVVQDLGLLDTFLALILPNAMSAYNMFILRNYFQQLPVSLEESAYMDGANPFIVLFRIILPISAPSLAAIAMFYGIANWNSYLDCLLYTSSDSLQVLQIYLRNLLASAGAMDSIAGVAGSDANSLTEETVKMTTIAVSVLPILVVYPFLQRYYTKGITVGAIKG